ncbi:MAG: COP23 domain-containing protein [Cyanobacteria bacterium P01_G01_bin.49]
MNPVEYLQFLAIAVLVLSSISLQTTQAEDKRDAFCKEGVKYPGNNVPYFATMIKNTTGNFEPLIYWVEPVVAGKTPEKRCAEVSKIIQARIDDKTWNRSYLRTGMSRDNYPVICFVNQPKDEECQDKDIIVKLKRGEDAETILDKMLAIRYRTDLKLTGEFRFYFGETERNVYVDINKFLEEIEN